MGCRESLTILTGLHTKTFYLAFYFFLSIWVQFLRGTVGMNSGLDDRHFQLRRQVLVNFGQIKQEQNFAVGWRMARFSLSSLCKLPLSSLPSSETCLEAAQISLFTGMWKDSSGQWSWYPITHSLSVSASNYSCCFLSCQEHKSSIKSLSPLPSDLSQPRLELQQGFGGMLVWHP